MRQGVKFHGADQHVVRSAEPSLLVWPSPNRFIFDNSVHYCFCTLSDVATLSQPHVLSFDLDKVFDNLVL